MGDLFLGISQVNMTVTKVGAITHIQKTMYQCTI